MIHFSTQCSCHPFTLFARCQSPFRSPPIGTRRGRRPPFWSFGGRWGSLHWWFSRAIGGRDHQPHGIFPRDTTLRWSSLVHQEATYSICGTTRRTSGCEGMWIVRAFRWRRLSCIAWTCLTLQWFLSFYLFSKFSGHSYRREWKLDFGQCPTILHWYRNLWRPGWRWYEQIDSIALE